MRKQEKCAHNQALYPKLGTVCVLRKPNTICENCELYTPKYTKIEKLKLKLLAIIDIIMSDKFYLITFTPEEDVDMRTQYNIKSEDIHDKI